MRRRKRDGLGWGRRACAGALWALVPVGAIAAGPVAQMRPVKDHYGATTLVDNYRWMETQPNPELHGFEAAAASYADGVLARIPGRARMLHALAALGAPQDVVAALTQDGDSIFFLRRGAPDVVTRLFVRGVTGGAERTRT